MAVDKDGKINVTSVCPHCGKENKTYLWANVNSELNPKISNKIVNDTFFDRKCSHCGENYFLDHSVMYKNEENACVVCYSSDDEGEAVFLDAINESAETCEEDDYMCTIRIVRDRNSLREKTRIFSMGVDDSLVEMFKVWGLEHLREEGIKEEIKIILCWVCDDGTLEISFFGDNDEAYVLNITPDQYEEAEEDLTDFLNEIEEEENYYVDLDWAMRVIVENDL